MRIAGLLFSLVLAGPAFPLEWNFGLQVDPDQPEGSFEVRRREFAAVPFEHNQAPVVLVAQGWLIPYGSTRLRITDFPVLSPFQVTPLPGPGQK